DRGGGDRRRRPGAALLDHRIPDALADHVLPARGEHRLRVLRDLRRDRRHYPGRAGRRDADPGLQGLLRRREGLRPRRVVRAIGSADADRDRAHRGPVQIRRAEGPVLMIENRPWLTAFSHAVLIAGIAVVAFPLYVTFVASTLTLEEILQV